MTDWRLMRLGKRDWQALSIWFATIVLLSGGFALYSYLYVERREQYFTERKLRELGLLGDRLKLQVENIANNVLPNAVNGVASDDTAECSAKNRDPSLKVYETDGTARVANLEETCRFLAVSKKTELVPNFTLEKLIEYRSLASGLNKAAAGGTFASRVSVGAEGNAPAFLFTYQTAQTGQDSVTPRWRGRIDVASLLGQSSMDSFDQLVVTDTKGEVVFQLGSTLRFANDAFQKAILKAEPKDTDLVPGKDDELSVWEKMKRPMLVVLLGIAGFLFFSQRKLFDGGVGFLGGLAAAATAFFNILDQVRGGRR